MPQYYVNSASGNDANLGTQESTPFKTIAHALAVVKVGDSVHLAKGKYTAASGETFPLKILAGVRLIGDESNKGGGVLVEGGGAYHSPSDARFDINITFVFILKDQEAADLRGLTIVNTNKRGTGVWIEAPTSISPTVANCSFSHCDMEAIFVAGVASPKILANEFRENPGYGIFLVDNANGEIRENTFEKNGVGIKVGSETKDHAAPLIAKNTISRNTKSGIIIGGSCHPGLQSNVIEQNFDNGLVVIDHANPVLGMGSSPGRNLLRGNCWYDLETISNDAISLVGNTIDPACIKGKVELQENIIPTPLPCPAIYTLSGRVMDDTTHQSIANLSVEVTFTTGTQTLLTQSSNTNASGEFSQTFDRTLFKGGRTVRVSFKAYQADLVLPTTATIKELQAINQQVEIKVSSPSERFDDRSLASGVLEKVGDEWALKTPGIMFFLDGNFSDQFLENKEVSLLGKVAVVEGGFLKMTIQKIIPHELIANRAYEMYKMGYSNSADINWFRAERELFGLRDQAMNKINFPLAVGDSGLAVADLQDALIEIGRYLSLLNYPKNLSHLRKRLMQDRAAQRFGDATKDAVSLLQNARRLPSKDGIVDSITAEEMNGLLQKLGLLAPGGGPRRQLVSGQVRRADGKPLKGVKVRAVRVVDVQTFSLGEATSDEGGNYSISYTLDPREWRCGLQCLALAADGRVLVSSDVIFRPGEQETIHLKIPINAVPYERQLVGRVVLESGPPASKLKLCFWRRDFGGGATKLGETTTDDWGRYSFVYQSADRALCLEVRAEVTGKEIILSKPLTDFPSEGPITFNLAAPDSLQKLPSEYSRLTQDITPVVGEMTNMALAKENPLQQDLTTLNRKTGWDARLLAFAATAQRLSADSDVGMLPEAWYGLLRAGLPSDKALLAQVTPDVAEGALRKVCEAGVVSLSDAEVEQVKRQFPTMANKLRLNLEVPGLQTTYKEMMREAGLTSAEQESFARVFFGNTDASTSLWDRASQALPNAEVKIRKLQLQGKLAFLTGRSKQLLTHMLGTLETSDLAQLVYTDFDRADAWIDQIHAVAGIPHGHYETLSDIDKKKLDAVIPPVYAGSTVEARRNLWAEDMARKVRLNYPTHVLARSIERDGSDSFKLGGMRSNTVQLLKAAAEQGFRLGQTPTASFFKMNPSCLAGLTEAETTSVLKHVAALQRVYQITPNTEAMFVLAALGVMSAYDVMAYGEPVFVELYSSKYLELYKILPRQSEPRLVYRKSTQVSSVTYNLFTIAKKFEGELPVFGMSASTQARENTKHELIKHFPTMESLFGSMDFCECEHCRSVLSPAAYLVDLLQFIDVEPQVWSNFLTRWTIDHGGQAYTEKYKKPYDALVERRPDLPHIQLTCENTNTLLPYIDLVNEILEYYVAHETLEAAAANDTGEASTSELLTEPQNIIREAYDKLREARYPLTLPFDLWMETARAFCDYFDVPLWQVLEVLRGSDELFVPGQPYGRASIFLESLRLSPTEIGLFTSPQPLAKWYELYGYENAHKAKTAAIDPVTNLRVDLNSAKALSRRLGVSYKQLVELVQTAFVNPKLDQLVVLYKLGVSINDVRYCRDSQKKSLYDQNQDLLVPTLPIGQRLPKDRAALTAAQQVRFDALDQDDWKTIKEIEAFEGRLAAFSSTFGLPLAQINEELNHIPFDQILVLADPDTGCDFDSTILCYASGSVADDIAFLKLNLFVRLWRKLGWTIEEIDCALSAFTPVNAPFDEATLGKRPLLTALTYLAHLKALEEKIRVGKHSRVKLTTLWANISTTGRKSLYEQLFLNRSLLKSDDVFDHPLGQFLSPDWIFAVAQKRDFKAQLRNVPPDQAIDPDLFKDESRIMITYDALEEVQHLSFRGVLTDAEKAALVALSSNSNLPVLLTAAQTQGQEFFLLKGHVLALQAALGLTVDDVRCILEDAGISLDPAAPSLDAAGQPLPVAELSLETVSLLYRYGLLAKGLNLCVRELISLKHLSGLDPFKPLSHDPLTKIEEDYPFSQTIRFVDVAGKIKDTAFQFEDLEYLLRHRFDETGKYRPNRQGMLALLKALSDGIRTIRLEHTIPADPSAMGEDVLRQKLGLVLSPDVLERFLAMMNGSAEFTAVKTSVASSDQLQPEAFNGESAFREVVYNGDRQEQKLTYQGVLFDASEKAALLARLPKSVPPNPHQPSAVLSDLLDDVEMQARAFFEKYLQKQQPTVQPATGFLDAVDFVLLFAPSPPGSSEAEKQERLRQQRTRLANAFLPFLQERLVRQFVVQTMTAYTAADPVLVESLLTDLRLLGLVPSGAGDTQTLLTALSASGDRGLSVDFFTATDGTGEPLASIVLPDADTGLTDKNNTLIRPAAARSARIDGYLEVPAAGAYRFFIALDKKTASADVSFEHLPGNLFWSDLALNDGSVLGDKPGQYIELKPGILYRFTVNLRNLCGGDARVLVQGEAIPKDRLSQLVLYPITSLSAAERAVTLLTKALALAQGFGLNEREFRYLLTHAIEFGNLDLKKLPTRVADDSSAGSTELFSQFMRLIDYVRLRGVIADGGEDLIDVFETNQTGDMDKVYSAIAKLTRRNETTVKTAAKVLASSPSFACEEPLQRLWDALQVIERFGVPVASVAGWTRIVGEGMNPEQRFTVARELKEAIKARYEPEAWQRLAQPIFNQLRQRQRDALVDHVMHQHGFDRMEQLYDYFLIDPGMEPVVQTSRIRLAISTLQLFIQRCFLNLEKHVPPPALINAKQWDWMKRYRVWEANRKIFLFPENWLEPEFRDDKTHLFAELESTLLQGDVSNDLVEDAFLTYLKKLDELARLEIVAMHLEDKVDSAQNTLHVFGRTYSEPHKYFYRRYANQTWTPWEPVNAEIEGDHLAPVIWRDRLYLFWVTFMEKAAVANTKHEVSLPYTIGPVPKVLEAQLHWIEYFKGEWSPRESGGFMAPDEQKLTAPSVDPRTVLIYVSKDPAENGEERGVYVHLGRPFEQAFFLAGRNANPEKRTPSDQPFSPSPLAPYSPGRVNATQYAGSGSFTVNLRRRITTGEPVSPGSLQTAPDSLLILSKNSGSHSSSFSILPCNNNIILGPPDLASIQAKDPAAVLAAIKSGLPEIASLMKPLFYQDNCHTLFLEPTVTEQTIERQEWVTPPSDPEPGLVDPDWLHDIPVTRTNPWDPPTPEDPTWGSQIWTAPVDQGSIVKEKRRGDWLLNPATALMFEGELVGPKGRLDVNVVPTSDLGSALEAGGSTVNVHPGSSVGSGATSVILATGTLQSAGLKQFKGGLNVIGRAGFNSTLLKNVDSLTRSGANAMDLTAGSNSR